MREAGSPVVLLPSSFRLSTYPFGIYHSPLVTTQVGIMFNKPGTGQYVQSPVYWFSRTFRAELATHLRRK